MFRDFPYTGWAPVSQLIETLHLLGSFSRVSFFVSNLQHRCGLCLLASLVLLPSLAFSTTSISALSYFWHKELAFN